MPRLYVPLLGYPHSREVFLHAEGRPLSVSSGGPRNDGTLEVAQRIAGHADSRTTKLYDRRGQKVLVEDMERIRY